MRSSVANVEAETERDCDGLGIPERNLDTPGCKKGGLRTGIRDEPLGAGDVNLEGGDIGGIFEDVEVLWSERASSLRAC